MKKGLSRAVPIAVLVALFFTGPGPCKAAERREKNTPLSGTETSACNYVKKNDFKNALAQYNKVIAVEPNNARAYAMRGVCEVKLRLCPCSQRL